MNPAKKLKTVVAPKTPRGIIKRGYKSPKLIPMTVDCPAFITIRGIAERKMRIILERFESPPLFHPNKSSTSPIPVTRSNVLRRANILIETPS